MRYYLTVHLQSDTTFGRGEGLAGFVDLEVEHDAYGCVQIGGRAIKGLLSEEWANLRFALTRGIPGSTSAWDDVGDMLFGRSGAATTGAAWLRIGTAALPPNLLKAIHAHHKPEEQQMILATLTTIRRQTSVSAQSGAPEPGSLRAVRVVLRDTTLIAPLDFDPLPPDMERAMALLSACVLAVRRGGVARNRGRGRLALLLHPQIPVDYHDQSFTQQAFARFASEAES